METVIALIIAPLVVVGLAAITKMMWDMRATMARDEERWARQAELWDQNALDHQNAFAKIGGLEAGQQRIEGKLDTLIETKGRN